MEAWKVILLWKVIILLAVALLGLAFGFLPIRFFGNAEESGVGEFWTNGVQNRQNVSPTITGTDIPDFGKTWYEIRGDLATPTLPGTSIPDFGQENSFQIETFEKRR